MAEEKVVKLVLQTDEALKKVDELRKRIEDLDKLKAKWGLDSASTTGRGATGLDPLTGQFQYPGAASAAGGSFIAGRGPRDVSAGEFQRLGEAAVGQMLGEIRVGAINALSRASAGQVGSISTPASILSSAALPSIAGASGRLAAPARFAGGLGAGLTGGDVSLHEIEAAAATFLAEGAAGVTTAQIRQRAQQMRGGGPIGLGAAVPGAGMVPIGTAATLRESTFRRGPGTALMATGPGVGGGGATFRRFDPDEDIDPETGGVRGRYGPSATGAGVNIRQPRQERSFMDRASMAGFGPAMLGLTFEFGAMPINRQTDLARQQYAQLGPRDPGRLAADQRNIDANVRFGQQADQNQQWWDNLGASVKEALADAGLGGTANAIGRGGQVLGQGFTAFSGVGTAAWMLNAATRGAVGNALGNAGAGIRGGLAAMGGGTMAGAAGVVAGGAVLAGGVMAANQLHTGSPFTSDANPLNTGLMGEIQAATGRMMGPTARGRMAGINEAGGVDAVYGPLQFGPVYEGPGAGVRARIQREARRDPLDVAVDTELATRAEAGYGLAGAQLRLGVAGGQMALGRRWFDQDQAREREQLDRGYGRSLTEAAEGTLRAQREVHIGAGQRREDIARGLGVSRREIGIGHGETVADIEEGYQQGNQDILFGSALTGVGGALIRNRINRGRALSRAATGRDRALGRVGRGAGDASGEVGIGEQRAIDASNRGYGDSVDAIGRGYQNAGADLTETQRVAKERFAQQEAINQQLLAISQDELTTRRKINEALENGPAEVEKAYATARTKLEAAAEKLANDMSRMLEGLAP